MKKQEFKQIISSVLLVMFVLTSIFVSGCDKSENKTKVDNNSKESISDKPVDSSGKSENTDSSAGQSDDTNTDTDKESEMRSDILESLLGNRGGETVAFEQSIYRTNFMRWEQVEPIAVIIRSEQEYSDYLVREGANFDFNSTGENQMAALKSRYDAEYFKNSALIMLRVMAGSGSVKFDVKGIVKKDKQLLISLMSEMPEMGTMDMAGWHLILEIPAQYVANGDEEAVIQGLANDPGYISPGETKEDM